VALLFWGWLSYPRIRRGGQATPINFGLNEGWPIYLLGGGRATPKGTGVVQPPLGFYLFFFLFLFYFIFFN
jgi:hypothetical protein